MAQMQKQRLKKWRNLPKESRNKEARLPHNPSSTISHGQNDNAENSHSLLPRGDKLYVWNDNEHENTENDRCWGPRRTQLLKQVHRKKRRRIKEQQQQNKQRKNLEKWILNWMGPRKSGESVAWKESVRLGSPQRGLGSNPSSATYKLCELG